ncbi:polyprenyl synthetase family protein [Plantactinospora sp. GCM10030261]|uniref:polyprenyl synthetase family protein n=1 Tax=Plantactinospora sp. GCM10030261 TaxID=3273420 RepID=UPI003618BEF0
MWAFTDEALTDWLSGALAEVELTARSAVHAPDDPLLTAIANHLTVAGGKRLRPVLALLAAQFGDRDSTQVIRAAAAVELVHTASLYHDDVIDEATVRRGVASVNARWSNRVAILAGDYLIAKAAELCVPMGSTALDDQSRILTRLVTGQLREILGPRPQDDPEVYYLNVIADKTAALFALAVRLGARAAGAPAELTDPLGGYGEALGMAFQLTDDVLDVTASVERSGKSAGADLRQGVATLPLLRVSRGGGRTAVRLRRLLAAETLGAPGRRAAARLLRHSGAIAESVAEVERYVDKARSALTALPTGPGRTALDDMCDLVLARSRALA